MNLSENHERANVISKLVRYVCLPPQISAFERTYLAKMNRIALAFFAAHVPALAMVALVCGTGAAKAAILASRVLVGPAVAYRTFVNPRNVTKIFGVTAMCMGGLLVHFGQGPMQIEMHFYFFVLIALLAVFADPTVILLAAATVTVHHLLLYFLLPSSVFNYRASLWVVAVHAAFVVLESAACCFVARSFFDSVIGLETIVRRRTEELAESAAHLRLMLNNAGQGFLTFDLSGTVSRERSAILQEWLGVPEPGARVWDYVRGKDAKVGDAFELGWAAVQDDFLPLDLTLDQLPKRMTSDGRVLELSYNPIFDGVDGIEGTKLRQILLVVSDRTDQVARERYEAENREILGVLERVLTDREGFIEFVGEASAIVSSLVSPSARLDDVRRVVHTLKGNCAVFGLTRIATSCHALEERLAGADVTVRPSDTADLVSQWQQLLSKLTGVLGGEVRGSIQVSEAEYLGVLRALSLQVPRREIVREMQDWRLEPTERRLARMAEQARAVAERLDKKVRVELEPNGVRVERTELVGLWSTLVHVVRNAVDHGIETEDERVAAGKPAQGVLKLETSLEGDELVFRAEDDGRGIDWGRVRTQAREMGLAFASAEDLQEAIMSSGFSTRDAATEHSGRGVGLHAVSALCRELGGGVRIESVTGRGACVEIRIPRRRSAEAESPKPPPRLGTSTGGRGEATATV